MTMESNDRIRKESSTVYRFRISTVVFLCSVFLPFTFHSNIWSLYIQPFTPVNCTEEKASADISVTTTMATTSIFSMLMKNQNQTNCCPCQEVLRGKKNDRRLWRFCQLWMKTFREVEIRKSTILEEWNLSCGKDNRMNLFIGSVSFSIAELVGVVTVGILADRYGRKLMFLLCLYIPVLFGSLAAFTTTYVLFLILRWPVGFLNNGLILLGFIMVIESCPYKYRAPISCLLLASIPFFGIIIGATYFFLLDWRHVQLLGSLVPTLALCYPWLIPESRRWYVNSHRISRVNKFLQSSANKQTTTTTTTTTTTSGINKIGSPVPITMIYDKPVLSTNVICVQSGSLSCLIVHAQMRTIMFCLILLWLLSSFCCHCIFFPTILSHPTVNYALMNAIEFFSFMIALVAAYKIGRRVPLAVFILVSGLSSISLAVTLLETGHTWLEVIFSLIARGCLRTCYAMLMLFTSELYPTSVRATGLAIGLACEVLAKAAVEILLFYAMDRLLLLFISGSMLCLSSCLIFPLPETLLYDIPDSLNDLQSMKGALGRDNVSNLTIRHTNYHIMDTNTLTLPRISESNTVASDLNELLSCQPKPIIISQPSDETEDNNSPINSQPETGQAQSNVSSMRGLTNPYYFATLNETLEKYDADQQISNRVLINIQSAKINNLSNNNNNNNNSNNNNNNKTEFENTKF